MFILVSKRNELSGGVCGTGDISGQYKKINVPMAGKQGVQNGFEVLGERQELYVNIVSNLIQWKI